MSSLPPKRRRWLLCGVLGCAALVFLAPCLLAMTPLIVRRGETKKDLAPEVAPGVDGAALDAARARARLECRTAFVTTLWDNLRGRRPWRVVAYERPDLAILLSDTGPPGDVEALVSLYAVARGGARHLAFDAEHASRVTVFLRGGVKAVARVSAARVVETGETTKALVVVLEPYPNATGRLAVAAIGEKLEDAVSVLAAIPPPGAR